MKKRYDTSSAMRIGAAILTLAIAITNWFGDESQFKVTTKRTDDRVEVKSEDDKAVFVFRSSMGISNATIERTTEQWPDEVVIRLRLKGLENLKLSTEKLKLEASISSQNGEIRLWKDGKEDVPLTSKDPFWIEIRILDIEGEPTKSIPLKNGYFEMHLPKMIFADNPKSLTLNWIDFYRN